MTFNEFKVKKSTGFRIPEKFWNQEWQKVRATPEKDHDLINPKLDDLSAKFKSIVNDAISRNVELTKDYFLRQWEGRNKRAIRNDLFKAYDQYIEVHRSVRIFWKNTISQKIAN